MKKVIAFLCIAGLSLLSGCDWSKKPETTEQPSEIIEQPTEQQEMSEPTETPAIE